MRRRHCVASALAERLQLLAPPPVAAASPSASAILTGTTSLRRSYLKAIVAPSADALALQSMCRRTHVILLDSGPFLSHGNTLIEACAKCGTDYVDITGDTPFMQISMELHSGTIKLGGAAAATAAAVVATAMQYASRDSCCSLMPF